MRLSHYLQNRPTYSRMPFEAAFTFEKDSFKNQIFPIVG
jgi:hypothetical protein